MPFAHAADNRRMTPRTLLHALAPRIAVLGILAAPLLIEGCGVGHTTQPITVPPLSAVIIEGADHDTLAIGARRLLVAVGVDSASGDTLHGLPLSWATTDPSVATVSSNGQVTGVSEGSAKIIASGAGKADTVAFFVRPAARGWITVGNTQATEDLHGVFFLSSGRTGWAVGNGGVILKSSDAGATWSRQVPTTFNLNAVAFSGSTGFVVGANGTVLKSTNLGVTWSPVIQSATSQTLRDVAMIDALHVWIVGNAGVLIGTDDGGASWTKIVTGTTSALNSIAFSGTDGWVVGDLATTLGTHDGVSWYKVPAGEIPVGVRLMGVSRRTQPATIGASGAVAVGVNGTVTRAATTSDSLAWALSNAGASYDLNAASFPIGQIVFAVGANTGVGAVVASSDGGMTWNVPQASPASTQLNDVMFVDALRGWAVGNSGRIRHTASGGQP